MNRKRPGENELNFHDLFERYGKYVAYLCQRLLGNSDDVDDIMQSVFVSALEGLHSLRDEGATRGWLRIVTIRACMSHLKRKKIMRFLHLDAAPAPTIEAAQEHSTELNRLYRLLDQLKPNERVAWTLRHVEEESLEEVARLCGCSLATAKRRITAAADKLARLLEGENHGAN